LPAVDAVYGTAKERAMTTVEIRLPRHVTISLGRLDGEKLAAVRSQLAEAERLGQGLVIAEHKRMQVIEINGMTTGRIVAELHLISASDPVATLSGFRSSPPEGMTVLGLIPAGMLMKAVVAEVGTAAAAT
jgi:hypothetical protein